MKRPLWKRAGYSALKTFFWLTALGFFRFRWRGKQHFPVEGGAVVCSNHQSYFDPILVGICFRRQLSFLARKTLFDWFLFGRLIRYLDAIPIDRDGMSLGGIKESLRRLRQGDVLVVFPEGTRSEDGQVGPLKPGFLALVRRGRVPILPAAVDGAYDAWPRSRKLPRLTRLCTVFGPMIGVEEVARMSDEQLMEEVRTRLIACLEQARALREK